MLGPTVRIERWWTYHILQLWVNECFPGQAVTQHTKSLFKFTLTLIIWQLFCRGNPKTVNIYFLLSISWTTRETIKTDHTRKHTSKTLSKISLWWWSTSIQIRRWVNWWGAEDSQRTNQRRRKTNWRTSRALFRSKRPDEKREETWIPMQWRGLHQKDNQSCSSPGRGKP